MFICHDGQEIFLCLYIFKYTITHLLHLFNNFTEFFGCAKHFDCHAVTIQISPIWCMQNQDSTGLLINSYLYFSVTMYVHQETHLWAHCYLVFTEVNQHLYPGLFRLKSDKDLQGEAVQLQSHTVQCCQSQLPITQTFYKPIIWNF